MATISLKGFTGEAPRITPRLLPATGAQIALDVRLEDGQLAPFRKPFVVADLAGAVAGAVKTLYRHAGEWLWWDKVVHAAPGPVATDRLYYTGDGKPKMRVSGTVYDLAIPAPTVKLTATNGGAAGTPNYTVLYVYTFVTDFGEETEPCPVSDGLLVSSGNVVTLSGFQAAPAGRAITKQRIYRSQTGTSGGTNFYFLAERAASTGNYVDTVSFTSFDEPLPSLEWNPPPDDLAGLASGPNGMMAAYSGKDVYLCEPWRPHAWPFKYVLTCDYEVTGLAWTGTTLVIGTKGIPYVASGTSPDTMVMDKIELNMPCLNSQGMIDLGYSVAYPSHDGLVVVQNGTANIPTTSLWTRDQWLALDPASFVCGQFYGRFFASYDYTDTDGVNQQGMAIIDLTGDQPFLIRSQHRADALYYEIPTGSLFMVIGTSVYEWDSKQSIPDTYTWRSKEFVTPNPTSFGALLFELDQRTDPAAVAAYNQALADVTASNTAVFSAGPLGGALNDTALNVYPVDGDVLALLPTGPHVTVNIYGDGALYASVSRAGVMQRLPAKTLARIWQVEVTGNANVVEIGMAQTAQELRSI